MDSNAQSAPEPEKAQNSAPDAPQRLENSDAQAKTDNRTETKADNPSTGKDKPKASQATNSNGETTVSADDAPQPAATPAPSDAVTVVLSGDAIATASDPKPATDDTTQTADAADPGTAATPAIVASATSAVAVALPVVPVASTEISSPAPDSAGKIATIESTAAASTATATSSPGTSAPAATPASASASPATLPTDAPEVTTVAKNPAIDATADQTASITTTKASTPLVVTSEASSVEAELAASAAASAQTAAPVPTTGKAKPSSTAPTTPTHVMTSADAEATDAPTTTPTLPGQTADASAPKGAERIDGKHDRIGSSADKADTPPADPKQSNTPIAAAPAEHRAPVAAAHSASLDLNLPPVQNPPQSFQAQTPNVVVTPAAQLNATLANTPVPVNGLAIDIALRAAGGASRFEIRLDPAELGRIDVRLDVDRHGNVTSHLTVEKPATLDMLRRDAPQLQQALENAGLKTGDSGLQFSLRDQSSGRNDDNGSGRNSQRLIISEDDTVPAQVAGRTYGRTLGSSGGVDIRV